MSLILISSDRFVEHQMPPGHPERAERAEVMDGPPRWRGARGETTAPHVATHEQLARVHSPSRSIAATALAVAPIHTFTSTDLWGRALAPAPHRWWSRDTAPARSAAMVRRRVTRAQPRDGPCLFNNIAVAYCACGRSGAARVALSTTTCITATYPALIRVGSDVPTSRCISFRLSRTGPSRNRSGPGRSTVILLEVELSTMTIGRVSEVVVPVFGSTTPTCCSCRPASTRTSAIRWPACA